MKGKLDKTGMAIESLVFSMQQIWKYIVLPMSVLTITGIFYPYFQWHLQNYLGIHPAEHFKGIITLFIIILVIMITIALFLVYFIKTFSFQQRVTVSLNPYTQEKMTPKEIAFMILLKGILEGNRDKAIDTIDKIIETGEIEL